MKVMNKIVSLCCLGGTVSFHRSSFLTSKLSALKLATVTACFATMRVKEIPLNTDNYGYLLIDEDTNKCAIVDVSGQPEKVLDAVKKENVSLSMILTTHKHWDHAGGNDEIKKKYPEIKIYGSTIDSVEGCTDFVKNNDEITFGDINIRCLLTPGHTMGHISFYCTKKDQKILFSGDTLFLGGCGKFFEGTGVDMYYSLYDQLGTLPPDTVVYCGHEYTLSNYRFALAMEPENPDLLAEVERAKSLRKENKPTIPSTIGRELKINPFMRVNTSVIKNKFSSLTKPQDILAAVRAAKDNF